MFEGFWPYALGSDMFTIGAIGFGSWMASSPPKKPWIREERIMELCFYLLLTVAPLTVAVVIGNRYAFFYAWIALGVELTVLAGALTISSGLLWLFAHDGLRAKIGRLFELSLDTFVVGIAMTALFAGVLELIKS